VEPVRLDRRTFVADLGRGALALAVLGVAACAPATTTVAPASAEPTGTPASGHGASPTGAGPSGTPAEGAFAWRRVSLGFVSAYILARGREAAIVDTGVAGSADAIGEALASIGLGWPAIGHVILTHHHGDHVGSAADVLERSPDATAYAGAADIPSITVPRPITAVEDGDRVFDLEVVTAPGHTAGSICVLDPASRVLVAGDALRTGGGAPSLPAAEFTDDMDEALASVAKLGALAFETLLVGHGDPIEAGAAAMDARLAAGS
jgi:glyoxylase-like metal-dependent hydrolase (beta-lactamase superfamily II)